MTSPVDQSNPAVDSLTVKSPGPPILGVPFDLVGSVDVFEAICGWRGTGRAHFIMIANPHSVMLCRRDPGMMSAARAATLCLPDGIGVILAARILNYPHSGRVTGPNLMLELCAKVEVQRYVL